LLTNLETNTKKLLQVILIGQPELQQLLQRRDLRQLAQRITARYHLMPLTKAELKQYIEHRLQVADCVRLLFNNAALAKIHQLSQGIPRLINLLCHSALMQAYNQNDSVVDKRTVIAAAERALGSDIITEPKSRFNMLLVAATASSLTAFIILAAFWWGQTQSPITEDQTSTSSQHTEEIATSTVVVDNQLIDNSTENKLLITKITSVDTLPTKNNEILSVTPIANSVSNTDTSKIIDDASIVESPPFIPTNELAQVNKEVTVSGNKSSLDTKRNKDYKVTEVEGVSSDLVARFQAAIDETQQGNTQESQQETDHSIYNFNDEILSGDIDGQSNIKPLSQMSKQLQSAIPSLNFEQHIYASDGTGWVNVNGRDRYEGDYIGEYLIIEKILPQQVILSFQGESFSLPALKNW
jgi:hypothetical protein